MAPLLVIGAALAALIIAQALPAVGLGRPDPEVQTRRAGALMSLVAQTDVARGKAMAREALLRAPLEGDAASLLGQELLRDGKTVQGERLIRASGTLSHRSNLVDMWIFDEGMRANRYDEAFLHADALLRRDVEGNRYVLEALFAAAGDPAAIKPLAARLALAPAWRTVFFDLLFARRVQPFAFPLFEALQAADSPPTPAELQLFLRGLVRDELYEQANLFWLLSLPPRSLENLGFIYDGEFAAPPTAEPFGWKLTGHAGGAASVEAAPGGGKALLVNSDGYTPGVFAQQLIVLPPGRYKLTGRMRAPANTGVQQLGWTLACLPGKTAVLNMPAQSTNDGWRRFEAAFTVPAEGCKGQMLTLRSEPGEHRTTLAVWYDDFLVSPLAAGPAAEARP